MLKSKKIKVNGDQYEVKELSVEDVFSVMDGDGVDNLKMLKLCVSQGGKPIDTASMGFKTAGPLIKAMNELNGFLGNDS